MVSASCPDPDRGADHFGEGLEGGQSLIASSGQVVTMGLEILKETRELGGDLLQSEGFDFDAVIP